MIKKTETVEQFLARGGKITRVPTPSAAPKKVENIKATSGGGPATIMSLDEADLYYGEAKPKKKTKKKAVSAIDISALPEELRKKYVDTVIYGENGEEAEEDEE